MDEKSLLQIFLDIVRIDSPSGHEEKVRDYVLRFLQRLGLNPIQDNRGNLIVKINEVGEPLLLGAHLDTVEPGRNIKPQIKNGIMKSDGSTVLGADNKVAVAALLEVLRFVIGGKVTTRPLDVIFTLSEESGYFGSSELDFKNILAKQGYIFDSLSPLGSIITASPFYNRFSIEIIGKSAHASMPHEGKNALKIFSLAVDKIELGKIDNETIANIGIVNGGDAINTIPGKVTVKGEVRSFVEEKVERYSNLIVDTFRKTAIEFGGKIEAEVVRENPGYQFLENDEFIEKTKKILKDSGLEHKLIKNWACSDANILNANGIKTLNLGDGVNDPHTVKESVSVENLGLLAKLIFHLTSPLHTAHV